MTQKWNDFDHRTLEHARSSRRSPTFTEFRLWQLLRKNQLGVRFTRQHCIFKYGYRLDFYSAARKLAIELDGSSHHNAVAIERDQKRDERLAEMGITTLRFSTEEPVTNVRDRIADYLEKKDAPFSVTSGAAPVLADMVQALGKLKDLNSAVGLKPVRRSEPRQYRRESA